MPIPVVQNYVAVVVTITAVVVVVAIVTVAHTPTRLEHPETDLSRRAQTTLSADFFQDGG